MTKSTLIATLSAVLLLPHVPSAKGGIWDSIEGPSADSSKETKQTYPEGQFILNLTPSELSIPANYLTSSEYHRPDNYIPPAEIEWDESKLECVVDPFAPYFRSGANGDTAVPRKGQLVVHPEIDFMLNTLYPSLAIAESSQPGYLSASTTEDDADVESNASKLPFSRSSFRIPEPTSLTYLSVIGVSFAASRFRFRHKRAKH